MHIQTHIELPVFWLQPVTQNSWPFHMTNRLSSSKTLLEGINKVGMAPADVGASRKRELEEKIQVTCQHMSYDSSLNACMNLAGRLVLVNCSWG